MTTLTDWLSTFLSILIKPSAKTVREEAERQREKSTRNNISNAGALCKVPLQQSYDKLW